MTLHPRIGSFPALSASILLLLLLSSSCDAFTIADPIVHFGIGAIAGGCGAIAYQPFDYVKAQIQSERGAKLYNNNGMTCFLATLQKKPSNLLTGLPVSVTGVAPEKSVKLGVNDVLKDCFLGIYGVVPLWGQIASGAVAGACQVLVSSPLDVIKVRLQTRLQEENYVVEGKASNNLLQVWEEVNGLAGLYRGVEACLIRDISFTAVCFPLYNALVASGIDPFLAGAMSGVVSTGIATPADFVKTRILTTTTTITSLPVPVTASSPVAYAAPMSDGTLAVTSLGGPGGYTNGTIMGGLSTSAQQPFQGEEEVDLAQDILLSNPNDKSKEGSNNPFRVAKRIVDEEGTSVLFTGVYERCVGAIPRFGITLGAHEWLEHYASSVGLLSSHLPS